MNSGLGGHLPGIYISFSPLGGNSMVSLLSGDHDPRYDWFSPADASLEACIYRCDCDK